VIQFWALRSPTTPDVSSVRSQLSNILGSVQFRNSKRSQLLLRFVVEGALDGRQEELKERIIGVQVFGRDPVYDTAEDAIVRNAAAEVRKRLAQYYLEPDHTAGLRIELPVGSYVPVFSGDAPPAEPQVVAAPPKIGRSVVLAAAALVLVAAVTLLWQQRRTATSEVDAFWAPLLSRGEVVQICVGQPTRLYHFVGPRHDDLDRLIQDHTNPAKTSIAPGELASNAGDFLYMRDAFAAARIASWVQSRSGRYQMISVSKTTYSQLRRSPMVAVGAFDNPWALRVTSDLRFVFGNKTIDGDVYHCVTDRQNPDAANWKVARSVGTATTQDYAIVTRALDPSTERTVISVAGIENYGTLAAGEFVTDPEYLGPALLQMPKDWRKKNIQIVLGTRIIEGTPGPPQVLATYSW